jgi:hypothetical protein
VNIYQLNVEKHQFVTIIMLTSPIIGSKRIKYTTRPLKTTINGTVTKVQNGQQGPATTIGVPSRFSNKKNIVPTRLAQQQKYLWKSSIVYVNIGCFVITGPDELEACRLLSLCSLSHLTDTANLWVVGIV